MQETKYVEAYSLAEFCVALQEAILEGYSVDTSRNETFPIAYGSHLTATLVKSQAEVKNDSAETTSPAVKRTKKTT